MRGVVSGCGQYVPIPAGFVVVVVLVVVVLAVAGLTVLAAVVELVMPPILLAAGLPTHKEITNN